MNILYSIIQQIQGISGILCKNIGAYKLELNSHSRKTSGTLKCKDVQEGNWRKQAYHSIRSDKEWALLRTGYPVMMSPTSNHHQTWHKATVPQHTPHLRQGHRGGAGPLSENLVPSHENH